LVASGETIGWAYRSQIPLTISLAMRGAVGEANDALAQLEARRHPSWRCVDYEAGLARAWVAAAQGAVSQAIMNLRLTAETARASEQFAPEVMCLQTATQFGDATTGARLRELEKMVEGSRPGLAARFAEALSDSDAAELEAVSEAFERLGDVIAAVDAAAHAAAAHRRADRKGSALTCSSWAHGLARRCGGADTPALRACGAPVSLTAREREVVTMLGQGLTSRAIAHQLTLSVRTVEGHIYRAMSKTGATDRDQLARILLERTTDT
jgi:DNA-binding CsgD family transcriptional regulator